MRPILAWLGLAAPVEPSGICHCSHPHAQHKHYRAGSDCGTCGCGRFRDDPDAVDLDAVCADHQVVEAVIAGDLDYALTIAPRGLVDALVAWRDHGRAAA